MSVVDAVTNMLETYLELNNHMHSATTFFHSNKTPTISIRQYLKRLEQYMKCNPETYVLALIYLDRATAIKKDLVLSNSCIHRLFFTALVVAAKFFEDKYYKNSYYCKVGGISNAELNTLEIELLAYLDFKLYVSTDEYENYFNTLMSHFGIENS